MNPQFLQQSPYYGSQPPNLYGEPNANLIPKGSYESQSFSPQKSATGLPTSNVQPMAKLLYENDSHRPPLSQANQNQLVDQMSNVSLSESQKHSSAQGFATQTERNVPEMLLSSVNGTTNQNHYPLQGEPNSGNLATEKSIHPSSEQKPSNFTSSLPYSSYGSSEASQFSGEQYSAQVPSMGSFSGPNISKNISQALPLTQTQMTGQQQNYNAQKNQQNITNSAALNHSQGVLSGPPLPGQIPSLPSALNQQNLSNSLMPGQNQHSTSTMGQQSISSQTLSSQSFTEPPMTGQQNLSRPPQSMIPQNLSGPSILSKQNLSGSRIPNQPNLLGPPLSSQQNLSGPPLPGQQNFQPQVPYANQMPGQRQYPSIPGQPNSMYNLNQGFQQPNYNSGQSPIYGNQGNLYQSGMPSGHGFPGDLQTRQKKPDPDLMPHPIQVFQEDQVLKGGDFITNQKGLVPPLVTTKFVVHDQGNASPRFIRSSMYTVPTISSIMKHIQIPFTLILSPMAKVAENEFEPPIINMGNIGPVRCIRCKAYMCPFMQFVDAGRRFQCMFCKATTEVPQEYFNHLDHTGQRMDRFERPELMLGTYEYLATKDYCRDNVLPKPPAILFVIDVSYNNIKSGLVNLLCSEMKKIIRNLPVDAGQTKSNMKIGFITYNNSVHFYNCKANLAQPQMMYVGDVQDVFMPLLEGFLCDPEESEATIDSLMAQIPIMFGETGEMESILGPAIQAGLEALKASECAGKLMVFHSSLPTAEAPGKLKNRDDRNFLGTDREKSVLSPQTNFYSILGQECVGAGCSVDLFLFNNSYIDVATIGQVSRLTGGEVYKYTYFQAAVDGERVITDIINNLKRPIAFDAVMRVRTSTGVRPTDFYGHLYMSNTTDIELASIDCDKAIAIEIKHDDKLAEEEGVYIQAALLYTSCSGIRRLRIINLSLKASSQMMEIYRTCDLDAMINFILKQSVSKLVEMSTKAIRDEINSRCAHILAAYRKHCSPSSNAGQLIIPECMKLLLLYANSLLKSDGLTGGAGITVDQKSYVMMAVTSMPIIETVRHVYPRLICLDEADPQSTELPPMVYCSIDKLRNDGAYLLENGIHMFMWLGLNLNSQWVQAVFGVASVAQVDTDKATIPVLDNSLNERIRNIISKVQSEKRFSLRLNITRQREKMEMVMRQFLVEDQGIDGSPSYTDYLCQMHKRIRSLLNE